MDILYFNEVSEEDRAQFEEDFKPILDRFVNNKIPTDLERYCSVSTIVEGKSISAMVSTIDGEFCKVEDVMRLLGGLKDD